MSTGKEADKKAESAVAIEKAKTDNKDEEKADLVCGNIDN